MQFPLNIQAQDKRYVVFEDRRTALLFPGAGQSLIDEESDAKNHKVETQPPGLFHSVYNTVRDRNPGISEVSLVLTCSCFFALGRTLSPKNRIQIGFKKILPRIKQI